MDELIDAYNPALPSQKAVTPPSAWYADHTYAAINKKSVQ